MPAYFPLLSVLWEDEALLAINKPAGLATLPDGYNPALPHVKSLLEPTYGRLWIVHRLDKDTSGILLLARTAEAHRNLNTQFEQHQVSKCYHALVTGSPDWDKYTVCLPLRPNGDRRHRTVVDARRGKTAITHLRVLERLGDYTLLEASPETGRTHQIRAHLAALGFSIAGDTLYTLRIALPGNRLSTTIKEETPFADLALHARTLEFVHPIRGERLRLEAPYPEAFDQGLRSLRSTLERPPDDKKAAKVLLPKSNRP